MPFNRTPCRDLRIKKEEKRGKKESEKEKERNCEKKSTLLKNNRENRAPLSQKTEESISIFCAGRDWFHLLQDALQKVPMCIWNDIKCELCNTKCCSSLSLSLSAVKCTLLCIEHAERSSGHTDLMVLVQLPLLIVIVIYTAVHT